MRPTNGRASGDGHDPNKISKQEDACLFTIDHLVIFIVLMERTFCTGTVQILVTNYIYNCGCWYRWTT